VIVDVRFAPLGPDHDRSAFDCGSEPLNRYFKDMVSQDMRRQVTRCFVACEATSGRIAGYYTMAAAEVPMSVVTPDVARKLPRYPALPAARIGRLAVDLNFGGRGVGSALIVNAHRQASASDIAAYALLVDAKDETAAAFYRHLAFIPFPSDPRKLFLPLKNGFKRLTR
jgi:GNAT superfamily N-acetyltransferase